MEQHTEVEEKLNKQVSEKTSLRAVVRIKVQKRTESFSGTAVRMNKLLALSVEDSNSWERALDWLS